jgi:hypothetical protein
MTVTVGGSPAGSKRGSTASDSAARSVLAGSATAGSMLAGSAAAGSMLAGAVFPGVAATPKSRPQPPQY